MEMIACIVISTWLISRAMKPDGPPDGRNTVKSRWEKKKPRKITDEELITVVLPTINNDK